MQLDVYSLKQILFEGEAVSLNCKTADGEITILDHHRPLITTLEAGPLTIIDTNQKINYINISNGFLEMTPENHLKLIVEE